MSDLKTTSRAWWIQTRGAFIKLATGGDWALRQSDATRRNLVWFWCDGLFASASDNIINTYLVVYILALGATQAQIGLMSALSSLSAAAMLMPGAMLVERLGRRRGLVLVGGGWARVALLLIALLPLLGNFPWIVYAAIGLAVTRDAMANLSFPGWMSMTADVVPLEGRGRYFSSRNIIMGIAGVTVTFLAGLLITRFVEPLGLQVALFAAFAIGTLSIFSFAHITDNPKPLPYAQVRQPLALGALLREMTTHREFLAFAAVSAVWNFSLNIAGPFFNVYLVKNLHADATMVGLTSIASMVAGLLAQRMLGELNDRWGARRLTMLSGLLIPIVPLAWVFVDAAWMVIPINLLGGALWGAYGLGSFNYLLMVTPEGRRERYTAIYQTLVTLSLASGAAIGSLVITFWNYNGVFIGSAAGRLVAALLFVWLLSSKSRALKPAVVKAD